MKSCRRFLVTLALSTLAASACTPQPAPSHDNGGDDEGGKGAGGKGSGGKGGGAGGKGGGAGGKGGGGGIEAMGGSAGGMDAAAPPDTSVDAGPMVSPDCTAALPKSLFCDPLQKMPKTIKETGLFPSAPDFTKHPPSMKSFTPFPPLWSDGMEKERFIVLPAGTKIDNSDPKQWVFPVGTIFIKTFFDDGGAGGKQRPIETRFIRRVGDENAFKEYDYYLYVWNAAGSDAALGLEDRMGDEMAAPTVQITINHTVNGKPLVLNNGQPFDHTLPSRFMCGECHQVNGVSYQTFIGFDEIRLNTKVTAAAAKTQLQEFLDAGMFMKAPSAPPRALADADPVLLKAKQFILGNCVHCHNAKGKAFDMAPEVFVANTVGMDTMAPSVHPPDGWKRVVAGDPEKSVVFVQARRKPLPPQTVPGQDPLRPMPPFGVNDDTPDPDGLAALKAWIMGLKK